MLPRVTSAPDSSAGTKRLKPAAAAATTTSSPDSTRGTHPGRTTSGRSTGTGRPLPTSERVPAELIADVPPRGRSDRAVARGDHGGADPATRPEAKVPGSPSPRRGTISGRSGALRRCPGPLSITEPGPDGRPTVGARPWAPDQEVTMARDPTRADERRPATAAPAVSRRSARQRRSRPRLRRALRRMVAMARRLERGARTATPIPAACRAGRARRKLGGQRLVSARASPVRTPSTAVSGLRRSSTGRQVLSAKRPDRRWTLLDRPRPALRQVPRHRRPVAAPSCVWDVRPRGGGLPQIRGLCRVSEEPPRPLSPQQRPPPDRSTVRGSAATAARPASRRRSSWLDEASPRPGLAVAPRGTDDAAATATTSCRCSPASSGRSRPPCRTAG